MLSWYEENLTQMVNIDCTLIYHTIKLQIWNMLTNCPHGHTYLNLSRKNSEAVHSREEYIILLLLSNKSARVITDRQKCYIINFKCVCIFVELRLRNINWRVWKYTSLRFSSGLAKTCDLTMQWPNTNLMADVAENIGLKFPFQSWF